MRLRHKFVDYIPQQLDDGVLYVSIGFGTVVHRCACGCGEEVVTPLGPAEWRAHLRRQDDLAGTVHWELEFPLPFTLLDRRRKCPMGARLLGRRGRAGSAGESEATNGLLPNEATSAGPEISWDRR